MVQSTVSPLLSQIQVWMLLLPWQPQMIQIQLSNWCNSVHLSIDLSKKFNTVGLFATCGFFLRLLQCLRVSHKVMSWVHYSSLLFIAFSSSSLTYMTIHERSFARGEEHLGNGSLDQERKFRLGSEVNSLSLSRCSSSDKNDPLENFRLTSNIKWESSASPQTVSAVQSSIKIQTSGHKSLIRLHCRI